MEDELLKQADELERSLRGRAEKAHLRLSSWYEMEQLIADQAKLIKALSTKVREQEDMLTGMALDNIADNMELMKEKWQDISEIVAEKDILIIGCTTPKITKAGHEVGCYSVHILSTHEDKWNGWVWHKENGNTFFPTHFKPYPRPPKPIQET